jgi:CHRD domain
MLGSGSNTNLGTEEARSMRRNIGKWGYVLTLAALLLAVTATSVAAEGVVVHYRTRLSGAEEVPAVDTDAWGMAQFKLSKDGTILSYKLGAIGLEGATVSHIHLGAPGVNGAPVVFLFGPVAGGMDVNGVFVRGEITADDLVGALAGMPLSALVEQIEAGNAYVNVHTLANPGGEIRGQIQ